MNQKRRFGVLYVDDESMSLKYFRELFEGIAPVFTAESVRTGHDVFKQNQEQIGLVLSDQKMPDGLGLDFLATIKANNPRPLRILVTAYADLNSAVGALNDGLLYSYLTKPWDPEDQERRITQALDYFEVIHQRDKLLEEKSLAFQQLTMADKAASMDILSCGLNHHMRNSLTAVHTFLELTPLKLEEELGRPARDMEFWGEFYHQTRKQIHRMTGILTNLWEASNSRDLKISDHIDIASLFRNAGTLVLDENDPIHFQISGQIIEAEVSGDKTKLNQMARLLFQESKTNLKNGGNIEISIFPDAKINGYAISFIDDGPPVAPEDLNRLFDPFYVRVDQPNEFGMNLVACYLIVFHHGGTMTARILPDGRNAIHFTLPRVPCAQDETYRISRELLSQGI
jgi:CheY-like chemotaxis protein